MKKILFVLCLSSAALASNLRYDSDFAVDLSTGYTYVVEKENNPESLVTVYDVTGKAIHAFSLGNGIVNARRTEIDLPNPDKILVVQQYSNSWTLRKFIKPNGSHDWKQETASEYEHDGVATSLNGIDEDHVSVDYTPVGGSQSQTLLINTKDDLKVINKIETRVLQALEQEAASKPDPVESPKGGLGLAAGNLAGMGFAYRRHFENKLGFQVGGIWSADDNSSYSNFGGQLIRTISRSERVRLFAMAGAGIYKNESRYQTCRPTDPTIRDPNFVCEEITQRTRTLNFGGGIGFEFMFGKRLGITAELPLTWKYNKDAPPGTRTLKGPSTIPAASIVYYFGGKK